MFDYYKGIQSMTLTLFYDNYIDTLIGDMLVSLFDEN